MALLRVMLRRLCRTEKRRLLYPLLLGPLVISVAALLACAPPPTSPPVNGTPGPVPPLSFQTLADAGRPIYVSSCAGCHGDKGQGGVGPALWGPGVTLGVYEGVVLFDNAGDMLNRFLPVMMPLSAKNSLSHREYEDVLAYVLLQDNQVSPELTFDESRLVTIKMGPYVPLAGATSASPATTPAPNGARITVDLAATHDGFSLSTMTVPAGAEVTIDFDNQDTGMEHNFAVYQGESPSTGMVSEPIFIGTITTGPAAITYTFQAPATPGIYFFRCDVRPATMIGTFVVK